MKRLSKLLLTGAIALGLVACNNEDVPDNGATSGEANTNVAVTLSMAVGTPAGPRSVDENLIGEWAGQDAIEKVTIYLVDATSVTTEDYDVTAGDYVVSGSLLLTPTKAIKTTAGIKKVYVVVNGEDDVITSLATTAPATFETAYREVVFSNTVNSGKLADPLVTSASHLAKKNGTDDETIVMTNVAEVTINVAPGVKEEETLQAANPKNRASVQVQRAVARVMVTTALNTYNVMSGADIIGEISNITWVLAQGENSAYIKQQTDFLTPNYGWKPSTDDYVNAADKYDYTGLYEGYVAAPAFGGTGVATMDDYATAIDNAGKLGAITDELELSLDGKFILPNTHEHGTLVGDEYSGGYEKGNTAYVMVRAKFEPAEFVDEGDPNADGTFYLGQNGKFYTTVAAAHDADNGGVSGQTVAEYVGGKVIYYAWVNPQEIPWYNSPVLRNNIYHIHITGFKTIGTNWNPLFPEDPDNPKSPEEGGNPDPKPDNEYEPENPIDPTEPLTTPETWMSVDVTVAPWKVHSYEVDLGI